MNKYNLLFISVAVLFAAGAALAQETVTIQDLGVSEPTLLPTSPFYFLKEISRGMQSLFTFNPVAKAELQLKISGEKAAEVKKITEKEPQNAEAVKKALDNYRKSQESLRKRLEGLKETSQNPKIDELLNKLTERTVKHEKLFDEISLKFEGKELVKGAIDKARAGSEELMGEAAKKDDSAKFASRLEKVLLGEKGDELKHARSVEVIDRLSGKTPEAVKESLERLREEFSEKLDTDIEDLVKERGEKFLGEKLAPTAKEQIDRAQKIIAEAEKAGVTSNLLVEARAHLENAKSAFEQKKYGEAFGQARSAEVLAKKAIKSSSACDTKSAGATTLSRGECKINSGIK